MQRVFRDRIAVVTGAASGIGRELSKQLVDFGATVWMTDIDEPGLEKSATPLGDAVRTAKLDVTDCAAFERLIDEVCERDHHVDFLFNNAGIAVIGHYDEMEMDDFNRLIDVNLRGVFHGVQAVYARMRRRGSGHIVNTSSLSGLIPSPGFTAYSATKHAVVGLSRGLRVEAARYGVRVSSICPGMIDTELATNATYRGIDPVRARKKTPLKFSTPQACAAEALRGVARNEGEILITRHAKGLVALQRAAPKVAALLAREGVKRAGR